MLTRNPDKARGKLPYARLQFFNIQKQMPDALKGATGVVNLAGSHHAGLAYAHILAFDASWTALCESYQYSPKK